MNALSAVVGMFLLRAAILLACFWAIFACLRSHPRARLMMCRIVSLALVALPLVSLIPMPTVATVASIPVMVEPVDVVFDATPEDLSQSTSVKSLTADAIVFPPRQPSEIRSWSVADLLLAVWLSGACLILGRWAIGLLLTIRLANSARPVPQWACEAEARLGAHLGLRRSIRLGVIDQACSPLLLGPSPLILLPKQLFETGLHDDILSAIAHELGHVKGRDWFWSQWLHVLIAVLWPMPLIWPLRRGHDAASEVVCDHTAAALSGGAEPYAGSLARQSLLALGHPRLATMPMLRRSGIRHRSDLLLSGSRLPLLSRPAIAGLGTLMLVACGVMGGIHLARAEDKAAAEAEASYKKDTSVGRNYTGAERQNIIKQLYGYFQAIDSLSYTGTEVSHLSDYYDNEEERQKTTFVSSGDRYFVQFDRTRFTAAGKPTKLPPAALLGYGEAYAFNGQFFQSLSFDKNALWIEKGPPFYPTLPLIQSLARRSYFTMPFDFVNKTMTTNPHQPVQLLPDQFKHTENWDLKTRRFQNGTLAGKQGIVMDVQGSSPEADNTLVSVLLDPSLNYYPVAWQFPMKSANGTHTMLFSYVATEVATVQGGGRSLLYPKTATFSTTTDGKPNWSHVITIDQVSLNDIAQDDPRFTFDPTKAEVVKRWNDPSPPNENWEAVMARINAYRARQKDRVDALHLPDGAKTVLILPCDFYDTDLTNLITEAVSQCPAATLIASWNSDGRYKPDHEGEVTPSVTTTSDDPKNPWPNWGKLAPDKAPAGWINPPAKSPAAYANDIYGGMYWALAHGFNTLVLINSFRNGDRSSATQAMIATLRAAHARLYVITHAADPFGGLADYARESGGGVLVDAEKSAAPGK
jgi:beta-lactamase regulating signal transducer with metallopeptidase domain